MQLLVYKNRPKNESYNPNYAKWANTWYILPAYMIWQLPRQQFQRYVCRPQNLKQVMWP